MIVSRRPTALEERRWARAPFRGCPLLSCPPAANVDERPQMSHDVPQVEHLESPDGVYADAVRESSSLNLGERLFEEVQLCPVIM